MPWIQAARQIAINSPLGEDVLLIEGFKLREEIGRPFVCEATLSSENPEIDFDKIVGECVTIRLDRGDGASRFINGYVARFVQGGAGGSGTSHRYHATIVPWLWFLTRTSDCRIFQEKSVPEIILEILGDAGFSELVDKKLTGDYEPREFTVQYRETSFNFISRLMEQEGIYYYFKHEDGKHKLVLADAPSAHVVEEGYEELRCHSGDRMDGQGVSDWLVEKRVVPGKHTLRDFDFKVPTKDLHCEEAVARTHAAAQGEIFDYPGHYTDKSRGDIVASTRFEELSLSHEVARATTDARAMTVGAKFTLTGCPREDQNGEYVIISMNCEARDNTFTSEPAPEELFRGSFTAVRATTIIRTPRTTPKPEISGPQTAIVVGPAGDEIYTDEFGRVKVHFHWDRWNDFDENASCWIRVSQVWAGKKWGMVYTPRVGQEVVVDFLDGDPDRPLIVGRVYNGDNYPPYDLPHDKNVSGLKSNSTKGGDGYNEISVDDTKGDEKVTIHAQYDMSTTVEHDMSDTVHNNRSITVNGTHSETIKLDTSITVAEGKLLHRVEKGTAEYYVLDAVTENFDATQTTTVKQKITINSTEAEIEALASKQILLHTGDTTQINMMESGKLAIKATDTIQISVGENVLIELKKDGTIKICADKIEIAGKTEAKIGVASNQVTTDTSKVNVSGAAINATAVGMHEIAGAVVKIN